MMRNAKLWSVLLTAVLLCACIAGVLFTGASASDSRIPTATTTYVVGTDGATIRACLEKASGETWSKDAVLEIQFSGSDSSIYASPDPQNGISGYTMFETPTIFREDDTKLPIVIRGTDEEKAATITSASNGYNATNDYYFTNLTIGGGKDKFSVIFYAGCGELVFENTIHKNTGYTYYYGDNQAMDTFIGWDAAKLAANVNDEGLLETGITFGNGVTGLNPGALPTNYSDMHFAAVGYNGDATCNPVIYPMRTAKANVTQPLSDAQVQAVKDAAPEATFKPSNIIKEDCIVKPWDTAAYLVIDPGTVATVDSTTADIQYSGARKGVSPVRRATIEVISGGVQYLSADGHNSTYNETTVGDTFVIIRGGRLGGYGDVGVRLTNLCMHVGNLTFEIHEDDPTVPTYAPWIQPVANSSTATTRIFGDYYFLMTGGTLGTNSSGVANGYYGAPQATGKVVNEVRGGQLWAFSTVRFGGEFVENTPISTVLPGTGEILTANVAVHNIISGGTFGGVNAEGVVTSNTGFFAGSRDGGDENTPPSVCNEITGGTFYRFAAANRTYSNNFDSHIYNFISGTTEKYPTFKKDFHGAQSYKTTREVTNVFKGCPVFQDTDGTKRNIFGGTTMGTVNKITNYLGGMPVFDDFYGGSSGAAPTYEADGKTVKSNNHAIVGDILNHIAPDDTDTKIGNYIWGGNGYYEGTTANGRNAVTGSLVSNVYSGTYGTFRAESSSGTDQCDIVSNVYGGTWQSNYMPVNRIYSKANTVIASYTVTNNIYAATFSANVFMGGENSRNQIVINNVYGGTFGKDYFGGGSYWVGEVTNNIYGGRFVGTYFGGGYQCGSKSITNNIYGGAFNAEAKDRHDYMGVYANPTDPANLYADQVIENNFYGADFGSGWTYCGHRSGTTGTITNTFYSGKENPVRDPENALYKYFDKDGTTTMEGGTRFRDQVVAGSGWDENTYSSNTCTGITNNLQGGCWTKEGGAYTYITFHGGMRWGIVNGDIVNNVTTGKYYRIYGGSDYGVINGNITNNFGKALDEGEEAPELAFYNFVGTSTSIAYVYGGGFDEVDFPSKISAALAKEESARSTKEKMYAALAATLAEGETYNCAVGDIVNNIYYGSFRQFYGGSKGKTTAGFATYIDSITNNVYGGTFTDTKVGGSTYHAYYGGCGGNANIIGGITNNLYGGVFNTNYYGGTPGSSSVALTCPTIKNNIYGGEGCSENKTIFLGNGGTSYTGTVHSIFYPASDKGPGWDSKRSYVFGGSANLHTNTEAEFAVLNEIRGGTFVGFWGIGGGSSTKLVGNVKTVVTGGTFNSYDNQSLYNAIAGATRNGTTVGDVVLEISGGTFNGHVVGGVIYGANDYAADVLDGNVTVTVKGGDFKGNIYGVTKPGYNVALAEGKTCTIQGEQTADRALFLGGKVSFDTFTANGQEIEIDENTYIQIASLTGAIAVKQTRGWLAQDYLKLPAGSVYTVANEAQYGFYTADDTILVKGNALAPVGATIRLAERLGVRVVLNADDVDAYREVFTYAVKLGDTTLAEGTYRDIKANGYSIVFDGIGLNKFGAAFTVSSPVMEDLTYSIVDLATMAQTAWAESAKWKAYADAIIEFHNVYNLDAENTLTPDAVAKVPVAAKGEADGIVSATATVLMSDAAGIRLSVTLNEVPANPKFVVGDKAFDAVVDGNTVSADIFFAHEYLAEEFVISVESDAGVHMTYTASIEAIANELANEESNENKDNAKAFLVYIQKAVACK